jgi:VCBS repeat-containing protein
MKKNLKLSVLLAILTLAGCKKEVPQQSQSDDLTSVPMAKGGGSGGGDGTVYLAVTVHKEGTEIQNDGHPAAVYTHGEYRVDARILAEGHFFFQTNTADTKTPLRWLQFANPGNYTYAMNGKRNYTFRTNSTTPLQSMKAGDWQEVGFTVRGIDSRGEVDWVLLYRNGVESTSTVTDKARVTKNTDGSWTIEPANLTLPPANAGLYNADGYGNATGTGSYHAVPFMLTLRAK